MEVTGETFFAKLLNGWMIGTDRVKRLQRCDARLCFFVCNCRDTEAGVYVRLGAKGKEDVRDRACISGLDTGRHALDVMTIVRFAAAVTIAPAARGFYYAESGWIRPAAHGAVSQVCVQRKPFTAVATNTTKGFNRMGCADLRQVRVAGEAVFGFT